MKKEPTKQQIKEWKEKADFSATDLPMIKKAMQAFHDQFNGKQGWVKASERLPPIHNNKDLHLRWVIQGRSLNEIGRFVGDCFLSPTKGALQISEVEWLDESADNPTVDSGELVKAIEEIQQFAIPDGLYIYVSNDRLSKIKELTIEALSKHPSTDEIRVKEAKERHKLQEENERLRALISKAFKRAYDLARYARDIGDEGYYEEQCYAAFRHENNLIEELQNKQL